VLDAAGVDEAIVAVARTWPLSPLVLGWVAAVLLRVSVGSATVAITTAASLVAPIVDATPGTNRELLVVAMGAGSLAASHVNDAGFWLVKEYFNATIAETLATWTVLETVIAVVGLLVVLLLNLWV
jgi:GntP family gluconate:H+ symporter